jgi:sugar O-acyltransferase (sialic acid O-acetyltransferase NeuD family)
VLGWTSGGRIIDASIVLIGAGGHARSCIDVIEQHGGYRIAGLVGRIEEVGADVLGHAVIGIDDDLSALAAKFSVALVAVGQLRSATLRAALRQRALEAGFTLPAIVSPHAYVSRSTQLGGGSIVMHQALLNAGVCVGENCIINSRAHLDHDVHVGADCHIATGTVLNGDVRVGRGTFIGSHSVIMEGLEIPAASIVPMGSVVTRRNLSALLANPVGAQP